VWRFSFLCVGLIFFQQPRAGALLAQLIARVTQRAVAARQASTANTAVKIVAQRLQGMNAPIQLIAPL